MSNDIKLVTDAEIVKEEPIKTIPAKVVSDRVGGVTIGKPLTPEQLIAEEERKIKGIEGKIAELKEKVKAGKKRISLYKKAISI